MATFIGVVKSVTGGDTVVVANPKNPAQERTFSLAYVTGPHLRKEGDEPYAFQSREHLRALAVGKEIRCTVQYKVPTTEREYGYAQLRDGSKLPEDLVAAGWLKVREDAGRKEESEEAATRLERLRSLEGHARSEGLGMWHVTDNGVIEVQNDLGGPSFLAQWKGKEVEAVIERVLSADRLLVRLLLSDKKHVQVMTLLAGVRAPSTARTLTSTGQAQPAEEFGNEAKAFVEPKLHQRRVKVLVVGANPQGQLIGSIIHPAGDIAELLLREGLARCNDFHSTMLGERMAPLRAAEQEAQAKKLRLHRHHVAKATDAGTDMVVSKIISADTILVRVKNDAAADRRINFSSIRGPRAGEPSEAPFRDEAKEFLRKRLIGKHVHIKIDGRKPATDNFEACDVATVTEKGRNVGLALVREGWASVVRHRKDDTDRAPNYDELLAAQEAAKEEGKGMWSGKPPAKAKQYVDVSESAQKARVHLSTLSRQRKVPAIVDFCKAGSRFTILIPRESVKLTMVLGGVRAPRAPRPPSEKGEPFGAEALELATRRCNQRDCEVDIYDMDKVGGFIGDLYVGRESFAKVLVEEGLASVHAYSAEKAGNATELFAAEQKAKDARKGMWHDYDPSTDEAARATDEANGDGEQPGQEEATGGADDGATGRAKKSTDYRNVVITNVDSSGKLKIQQIGHGTAALETLMTEFKKFHLTPQSKKPIGDAPRAGDYVAAKFSEDGQWYRARIRSNDRTSKAAEVVFIDYGNVERKPWAELRPLDQPQFSTQRLRGQAIDASLSLVQLPVAPEYFADARAFIADVTDGAELVACWDHEDAKEGVAYVTLYAAGKDGKLPGPDESINHEVVAHGHGMVPRKLKPFERAPGMAGALKTLREAEVEAKAQRRGMWEYGDITED